MRRRDFLKASAGAVALGTLPACERSRDDSVGEPARASGYHGFYLQDVPWIGSGVREGLAALAGTDRDLNAGLYLPTLDPAGLEQAVGTAREAGASGVSFFEMEGLTEEHLAVLRGALT